MPKAFTDYTEEDYNLVMNTNVASFFYMTQQMTKQNSGHVVSISGVSVDQPSGAATELLAVLSKSPMPAASKALALEYAANNIRFNTVSPAVVNTPMHAKGNHAELAKLHPLARMGEVSDVVADKPFIALLGEPGIGKSSALQRTSRLRVPSR